MYSRRKIFYFLQNAQTDTGTHLPRVQIVIAFLAAKKRQGREVDRSPPSGADVKNEWSYTSFPLCLHSVHEDEFTFISILVKIGQHEWTRFVKTTVLWARFERLSLNDYWRKIFGRRVVLENDAHLSCPVQFCLSLAVFGIVYTN
jgi:hypothetical protein